jgi:hypothetical protein
MRQGSNSRMRLLCLGMLIAGLVAAVVHGWMSVRYAQRLTVDAEGWWVQGGGTIALSILGWLFAGGAGLLADKRTVSGWIGTGLMMVIAVGFVGYTVSNSTGYAGFQVYSKTRPAEARRKAAEDVAAITNKIVVDERKELRTELFRTYAVVKTAEKEKVLGQIEALSQKPVVLQIPDAPETAVIDPRAEVARSLLGVDMEKAQALSIAALPILLVIGEILGPFLSALLWPHAALENRPRLNATLQQLSVSQAKSDVLAMTANGTELCVTEYGERWGVNKGVASRWLDDFQRQGVIKKVRRGARLVAVAPARANGHIKLVGSMGSS